MKYSPFALIALATAASLNAAEVFVDTFNSYTPNVSIAGANWDPTYHSTDTSQRDLLTAHTNGYAVLDTSIATADYHAPAKHGFTVGNSGGTAIIQADIRYNHASGGDISANYNQAAFGLLISTTASWDSGTNQHFTFCNRDGGVIGNRVPVAPWVEGSISHTSLGVDTTAGGLSDWFTVTLTLSDLSGSLYAQAVITDTATGDWIHTSSSYPLGINSTETLYAGISTDWNNLGTAIADFSKITEVHIDNFSIETFSIPISVTVQPEVSASIGGELILDRSKFINLSALGERFEGTINNQTEVDYYTDTLGMHFGRELGGVWTATRYSGTAVREDSSRPGYVDITHFANNTNANNGNSTQAFRNKFSPNLGSATHDRVDGYPSFMVQYSDGSPDNHMYPSNVDAAAEFATAVLQHRYTDWTRPATYEIVNEPNYRIWDNQTFADLHTAIKAKVDTAGLDVDVGGPCLAVGYYYKDNYQKFSLKDFIDNTNCDLDFYSFHVYDFMTWNDTDKDFEGRVSTGLPIEGVLDLIQNYTHNAYSKEVPIVLSEHAGYIYQDQEIALDAVANQYFPGSGFDWEMKRRSVSEFIAVSSSIANTMAFMNNPHIIQKAVPFILLESAAWDPRYYSTLLVKENFDPNSNVWHESTYVNFYKYYQNVSGRRVRVQLDDPDIQTQAYVNGDKLYILLNNLATKPEGLDLSIPETGIEQITIKRIGRNADFTPYFTESTLSSLNGLTIASREAIALEIDYTQPIIQQTLVDERPYYGNLTQQSFTGSRTFNVAIPDYSAALYATLRIGIGRGTGTDQDLNVTLNGTQLNVPIEDCADYLEDSTDYASTKLINVPANLLQANNTVVVAFPNNGNGGIGSVVIRAAIDNTSNQIPLVNAGNDQAHETPTNTFTLAADVFDDALPEGVALTSTWTQISGPMAARIDTPTAPTTNVTCYFEGTYVFRITAFDGEYTVSDEVTVTITEPLAIESITLFPIEDAYIQNGATFDNSDLRVETSNGRTRTAYMKFQIPNFSGTITNATLKMSVTTDPGSGTLRSHIGSHNNWNAATLSTANAPSKGTPSGFISGALSGTQYLDMTDEIPQNTPVTIILSMDSGGNDVSYGSSESGKPPELQLTVESAAHSDDLDADNMLDSWEKAQFGSILFSDGKRNSDGDSQDDYFEYIAGTDPNDANSRLQLSLSKDSLNPGLMRLEWDAVIGRRYDILYTPDLNSSFLPLINNLTNPDNSYTDPNSAGKNTRFYQIQVELDSTL